MNRYRIVFLDGTINYGTVMGQYITDPTTRKIAEATAEAMMPKDCRSYAVYLYVD